MASSVFDRFHPAVALGYFAVLLVFSMATMQPVYLLITFAGAFALSCALAGPRQAVRSLGWQLPLIAVLALANPLFVSAGSTELFRFALPGGGVRAVYLEALAYGACAGLMLAGVLLVFGNAARVLSSDKVLGLLGNAAPTVALMVSMTARLVPQYVRRGRAIGDAQAACTAARQPGAVRWRDRVREKGRITSVLMGWGMEDSLETADAMRARGWGGAVRRTTYARRRFRAFDAAVLAAVGALALAAAAAAIAACAQFAFYPRITGFAPWWSYLPYAVLAFAPAVFELKERAPWNR